LSQGYAVRISCVQARLAEVEDAPAGWTLAGDGLVGGKGAAGFSCMGLAGDVELDLYPQPTGGIATVGDVNGSRDYDLYAPRPTNPIRISIPANARLIRYTARVARKDLADARIALPSAAEKQIFRLYLGTLIPVIAYPLWKPTIRPWGAVLADWRPAFEPGGAFAVPPIPRWERGGAATFLAVFAAAALLLALLGAGVWLAWRLWRWLSLAPEPRRVLAPFHWGPFLALWVPLAAAWLAFLGAYYPGTMSNDSVDQWKQAQTMVLNDWHPAFHTLTIKLLTLVWHSPAAVALAQILALSLLCAWGYSLLLRAGVPRFAVLVAWLVTLGSLRNGMMAIVLWKDVPYSAVVFAFTVLAARWLLDARIGARTVYWVGLGVALGLFPLYRHNGLPVLLVLLLALPFVCWPVWKKALVAGAAAVLLLLLVKGGLYPLLHVSQPSFAPLAMEMHLQSVWEQDVPLGQEDLAGLRDIEALPESWPSYVGFGEVLAQAGAIRSAAAAREWDSRLLRRCPLLFVRDQLRVARYAYWPTRERGIPMATVSRGIEQQNLGLATRPILPRIHEGLERLINRTLRPDLAWLVWSPAVPLYWTLAGGGLLFWRLRDPRWLIVFLPVWLNTAAILLFGPNPNARYQYPVTLAAAFLACLALLPKEGKDGGTAPSDSA
ncbi:MAG: hypothetical protein NTW86_28465, partial [Candidatus Sumerlaeota bacterium]|nr:hypothetical protein [Candidatus Sumerlaeota bacterium]